MNSLKLTICPRSAFGTPLAGDTLFGQICWAIRERFGNPRLRQLLEGYTEGYPFVVLSDAFPAGCLPAPALPKYLLPDAEDDSKRSRNAWLPVEGVTRPLREWIGTKESTDTDAASRPFAPEVITQNTINRLTGTTGTGQFAPRQYVRLEVKSPRLDIYCILDEARFSREELRQVVEDVGQTGYGRDASTGLGKFTLDGLEDHRWPSGDRVHVVTLAPCAPDPRALDARHCYFRPLTRFGRHGNVAALMANPFKRPVLLLQTAAFLTLKEPGEPKFLGVGLGGNGTLSTVIPETVHQGYAPVAPLNAEVEA